jgi:hypothetical protein
MNEHTPVLVMNVDGVLYPVGMTSEQTQMLRLFVKGLSKDKPLSVLSKAPIIEAYKIANEVKKAYETIDIVK